MISHAYRVHFVKISRRSAQQSSTSLKVLMIEKKLKYVENLMLYKFDCKCFREILNG